MIYEACKTKHVKQNTPLCEPEHTSVQNERASKTKHVQDPSVEKTEQQNRAAEPEVRQIITIPVPTCLTCIMNLKHAQRPRSETNDYETEDREAKNRSNAMTKARILKITN